MVLDVEGVKVEGETVTDRGRYQHLTVGIGRVLFGPLGAGDTTILLVVGAVTCCEKGQ